MKTHLFLLLGAAMLILIASTLPAQDLPQIEPGSEAWKELFIPANTKPTEIPVGEPLRRELFDLLRVPVEKQAGKKVLFEGSLRVFKNWAIFTGRTVNDKGDSVRFPPLENDDTAALWLRTQSGWTLVESSAGHSDAFYLIWPDQYGMPKELLLAP